MVHFRKRRKNGGPEFGDKMVDHDEDFKLGKLIPRAGMDTTAKWHECIGSWSNLMHINER